MAKKKPADHRIKRPGLPKFWRAMIFGYPGRGKTTLAGTGKNTLIIRPPSENTTPIAKVAKKNNVQEWVAHDWSEMDEVFQYLLHEGHEWDNVWFDSVSLWQDTGLDSIWEETLERKPERAKFGLDKGEYGINMHRLSTWVRGVVGLEAFNFGMTAHPFEGIGPDDELLLMPYVQGKNMATKFCGYCHLVGWLDVRKVKQKKGGSKLKRVLDFNSSDRYYAKDQFGVFGRPMVDPTIPKIEAKIKKG